MRAAGDRLGAALRALWGFVREWSGDAAYEAHALRAGACALSRQQFWLETLRRRYDTVNRCC